MPDIFTKAKRSAVKARMRCQLAQRGGSELQRLMTNRLAMRKMSKRELAAYKRYTAALRKTVAAEARRMFRLMRKLRRERGVSIPELSKQARVKESMIRRIEG